MSRQPETICRWKCKSSLHSWRYIYITHHHCQQDVKLSEINRLWMKCISVELVAKFHKLLHSLRMLGVQKQKGEKIKNKITYCASACVLMLSSALLFNTICVCVCVRACVRACVRVCDNIRFTHIIMDLQNGINMQFVQLFQEKYNLCVKCPCGHSVK